MSDVIVQFKSPNLDVMVLNDEYTIALYTEPSRPWRLVLFQGIWDTDSLTKYFTETPYYLFSKRYEVGLVSRDRTPKLGRFFRALEQLMFKHRPECYGLRTFMVISYKQSKITDNDIYALGDRLHSMARMYLMAELDEIRRQRTRDTPIQPLKNPSLNKRLKSEDTTSDHDRRMTDMLVTTSILSSSSDSGSSYSSSSDSSSSFSSGD